MADGSSVQVHRDELAASEPAQQSKGMQSRRRRMSSGGPSTPTRSANPERRGRLGQVRSLDGSDSGRRASTVTNSGSSASATATSKQSFSLRQLALNSRALAGGVKKSRGTLSSSEGAGRPALSGALGKLLELSGATSSLSGETGAVSSTSTTSPTASSSSADEKKVKKSLTRRESSELQVKSDAGTEDEATEDEETEYEKDATEDFDDEYKDEEDDDEEDEEDEALPRNSCKCQPVVSGLDKLGRPVSDVDLISYRDLCQLVQVQQQQQQQQRHYLRSSYHHQQNRQDNQHYQLSVSSSCTASVRRTSLQEESGAYYELCTPQREQVIRQKYAWCPASLLSRKLELIDRFFASFPAHKVPLLNSPGATYREEQISFQLAKQDISLEYSRYPLDEPARQAYAQFVERRNSHALNVGLALELPELLSRVTAIGERREKVRERDKDGSPVTSLAAWQPRCRRCLVRFEPKQMAVLAPTFLIGSSGGSARRAIHQNNLQPELTNAALFHPNCFTCSTCKEFLVDLVYCLRDNKLYCFRHYGDSLRPRCAWCQELIFSDEYLKAMNESFHVDHFLCRHCDSNLAGQRYVLKEEKPYCIQCYESQFANTCDECHKPIGIDSRDLSYKERHWHDSCFVCNKCQQSLIDKPFGSKTDKVYCAECYDLTFATRCDGCKNPFRAGSKKMEYRGRQWHDSCFCCCVCHNTIGSNSFIPKNDEVYCIKCYEDKYATRCTKCKQVIVSGGVTFRNEPWHRDCFNCCNCNKSLAGQRFTTRDITDDTVKTANKTNQPHNAYCVDCYGELFAKKCYACSKAITGLGGTRFVTFEDRSWHNDCFICNDCNTSLVGKGFIADGPESILCAECARAKLR